MSIPRQGATATLLGDGRVLVAGGATTAGGCTGCGTDTAEIFDPATNSFAPTGSMHAPRRGQCANLLAGGKVRPGGFDDANDKALASAELYDPASGVFTLTGKMLAPHFDHTANSLPGGKVLIAGGFDTGSTITNTAELYESGHRQLHGHRQYDRLARQRTALCRFPCRPARLRNWD